MEGDESRRDSNEGHFYEGEMVLWALGRVQFQKIETGFEILRGSG